ncbi:MAG: histidinol-phosphatase [Bacteroidaceae bacterium]
MNLTTYHSHCSFCDGRFPMEDFVRTAIQEGFSSYGISSHAPLPFSTHWTMDASDLPLYFAEFNRLKGLYGHQLELYVGLEIDYLNEMHHPAIPFFQELPLDYRIGSIHMLYGVNGEVVDIDCKKEVLKEKLRTHFGADLPALIREYYRRTFRMIELGGIDVLGHFDKLNGRADFCQPGIIGEAWVKQLLSDLMDAIAEKGLMVEINTKKFLSDGVFFPNEDLFPELLRRGIPVQVNSDAHYIQKLNDGRYEALKALYKVGYRTVRELRDGQWVDAAIEL